MPVLVEEIRSVPFAMGQRVSARITAEERQFELWFNCPGPACTMPADAFLAVALLPAMRVGQPLVVDGCVSQQLLRSCATLQEIYCCWSPKLSRVSIEAAEVRPHRPAVPDPFDARAVGATFSGGVDAFYTVLKHRDEVRALVFAHGLDVPLDKPDLRASVAATLGRAAARLKMSLLEVETNLRYFSDSYMPWHLSFGPALCAIGMLLSGTLQRMYVAAGQSYRSLQADGAHPLLNPLFSTGAIRFEVDGCERTRLEKVEAVAGNEIVRDALRVCFKNTNGAYNCCRCEKCLRTMVSLEIVGVLRAFRTFHEPLNYERVIKAIPYDASLRFFAEENLEDAVRRDADPRLIAALRESLAPSLPRRIIRKLPRGRLRYWCERSLNIIGGI
jgi:hypothetical protein